MAAAAAAAAAAAVAAAATAAAVAAAAAAVAAVVAVAAVLEAAKPLLRIGRWRCASDSPSSQPWCRPRPATSRAGGCNPHVLEAATLCGRGCNPACQRLQPHFPFAR